MILEKAGTQTGEVLKDRHAKVVKMLVSMETDEHLVGFLLSFR